MKGQDDGVVAVAVAEPVQGGNSMGMMGSPYQQQPMGGAYQQQQMMGSPYQQQQQMMGGGYPQQMMAPYPQQMMPMEPVPMPTMGPYESVAGSAGVIIKQRLNLAEMVAGQLGCGCAEQRNMYDVYDASTGTPLLFVQEESDLLCRVCCKPNHELKLFFMDSRPGVPPNTLAMRGEKPFKLNCCACADICQREMTAHVGDTNEPFTTSKMPSMGGGGFSPKVAVMDRSGKPYATMEGPSCVVGGIVELCSDIEFKYMAGDGKSKQQIARIIKKKPSDLEGGVRELMGDSDVFVLEFPADASPEQKMTLVNNALLLDYLFFEGGPPFEYNPFDNSCTFNLAQLYCFGCLCPCQCKLGGNSNN